MSRPTILDQLTSPTVSPGILRNRAQYWRTVAARNERHGRIEQAARLRVNCDAMDRQADDMECNPIPSIVSPRRTQRSPRVTQRRLGAEAFWTLHSEAVSAIRKKYGANWKCAAPLGQTVLASLPAPLRFYKGPLGGTIRYGRDHRVPAATYWRGGEIPGNLEFHADYPRETRKPGWKDDGYAAWQAAWAKRNGLVRCGEIYLTPAEAMRYSDAESTAKAA